MLFSVVADLTKRHDAELLVLPFWEKPKPASTLGKKLEELVKPPILAKDFHGKEGESALLYGEKEKRILLIGLGKEEKITIDSLRKVFGFVAKMSRDRKIKKINLLLPNIVELRNMTVEELLRGVAEGILSANYVWEEKQEKSSLITNVCLIGVLPKTLTTLQQCCDVAEAVYFARDLINGNADLVTPQYIAHAAKQLSTKFPEMPSISDIEMGEETNETSLDLETESMDFETAEEETGTATSEEPLEEEEEEAVEEEEDPFSDRNRWRRGGILDPDANEW